MAASGSRLVKRPASCSHPGRGGRREDSGLGWPSRALGALACDSPGHSSVKSFLQVLLSTGSPQDVASTICVSFWDLHRLHRQGRRALPLATELFSAIRMPSHCITFLWPMGSSSVSGICHFSWQESSRCPLERVEFPCYLTWPPSSSMPAGPTSNLGCLLTPFLCKSRHIIKEHWIRQRLFPV